MSSNFFFSIGNELIADQAPELYGTVGDLFESVLWYVGVILAKVAREITVGVKHSGAIF